MSDAFWTLKGRCWLFGDDIAVDGDLMPLEFALRRELRPEVLKDHIFSQMDQTIAARIKPGDIIVAGKRFAQGNPHIQGLIGLAGAGVGLVVESIPSGSYRNAINAGLRFLPRCRGVRALVANGDHLEVNFASGAVSNLTSGASAQFDPLPPLLQDIVAVGGWAPKFRRRLSKTVPAMEPPHQ
jgi:3-isopropylmalate/(R)-2-methylmalate dehydratase small subunit